MKFFLLLFFVLRGATKSKKKNSKWKKSFFFFRNTPGIADGVGGWAESGVNPAEYARELMAAARRAAEGFSVPKVTAESLAAARAAVADSSSPSSSPSSASSASSWGGEGLLGGVPLACTDAAGGGAPAPFSASSSPSPFSSSSAPLTEAAEDAAASSSSYGEDGGASPLEALLSSSATATASPLPASEIPKRALEAAHAAVRLPGSATACVVALDPETATLHGVSVGDSGALVVRKNFLLFRSRNSSHSFDCPRQLAAAPEHVEWSDVVEDGEAFEVEGLEEGK